MTTGADHVADHLVNLRDVGGLPTSDGAAVRPGVLYRSEVPQFGDTPPTELSVWPPAAVIDLRADPTDSHPLGDASRIHWLPMDSRLAPDQITRDGLDDRTLVERYHRMAEKAGPQMRELVDIVVESKGPVLVHCLAGKDRTGVVVGLLLRAVGVGRDSVVADYSRTNDRLPELLDRLRAARVIGTDKPDLLAVLPEALTGVLDVIEAGTGSPVGWLREHGVRSEQLARLRTRLVD